jgi:hypothetical protein
LNDREDPLLLAVEGLTRPITSKVLQDTAMVTVELPPLLTQLYEAIAGSVGIGGSGSLANERNMLDGDALYRFSIISTTIRDWARMVGAEVTKDEPVKTLQAWRLAYRGGKHEPEADRFYIKQLHQWAGQIVAKLDPPRTADLPDACPVCEASTWWKDGEEFPRPLTIQYRDGPSLIDDAKGLCRACEHVWSARELAYEIEQKATG